MVQKINTWLSNPKRKYAVGLQIFQALASDKQKSNFKEYFEKDADLVKDQFDIKFTTLVNQVAFISNRIKANPEAFKKAIGIDKGQETGEKEQGEGDKGQETGDKKVDPDKLPEELQPVMARIKEIVPLMAKLHADMSNEPADDKRIPIIQELVKLDNERRRAWATIDNYEPSEEETHIEAKTIAMGADIQKRIVQLKELISRAKSKAKEHSSNGKKELAAKAVKRGEKYTDELAQLEMLVK